MDTPATPFQLPQAATEHLDGGDYKNGASSSSASAHVHFAPSNDISLLSMDESVAFKHGGGYQYEESWDEEDEDSYLLAKSLFDHHQWERCAALLEKRKVQGFKALFLKLYAKYLVSVSVSISLGASSLTPKS